MTWSKTVSVVRNGTVVDSESSSATTVIMCYYHR